jgi:hypothetical protein
MSPFWFEAKLNYLWLNIRNGATNIICMAKAKFVGKILGYFKFSLYLICISLLFSWHYHFKSFELLILYGLLLFFIIIHVSNKFQVNKYNIQVIVSLIYIGFKMNQHSYGVYTWSNWFIHRNLNLNLSKNDHNFIIDTKSPQNEEIQI